MEKPKVKKFAKISQWWEGLPRLTRQILFALVAGTLAAMLVIYFYSPQFVFWRGLEIPSLLAYPEVCRGYAVLLQLHEPFTKITQTQLQVLNFRLFFPIIGHYLHLSDFQFLALPHLGCLLNLWLIAALFYREMANAKHAFMATAIMGATSWFFVSTGWLGYFDSWCVLGLLAVTFVRSKLWLVAACLLTPLVDERLVLTLPMCLLARGVFLQQLNQEKWRSWLADGIICALFVSPYLSWRAYSMFTGSGESDLKQYFIVNILPYLTGNYLDLAKGVWMGLRGAWFFVLFFGWAVFAAQGRTWGWIIALCGVVTLLVNLFVAADLSRSMSVFIPVAVLGTVLCWRMKNQLARQALLLVFFINLLTPARHVLTKFQEPIMNLNDALVLNDKYRPLYYDMNYYVLRGTYAECQSRYPDALVDYATALKLASPNWPFKEKVQDRIEMVQRMIESGAGKK